MNLAESFLRELIERWGPISAVGLDLGNRVVVGVIGIERGTCKFIPQWRGTRKFENLDLAVRCAKNISQKYGALFIWAAPHDDVGPMARAILRRVYEYADLPEDERKLLESALVLTAIDQLGNDQGGGS